MLTEPNSMEELAYFTRRTVGESKIVAWVYRGDCPKCGKAKMQKPQDPKTGKIKRRAKEYVCPECGYVVSQEEYEPTLKCQIKYTCPKCQHKGEIEIPYKRKKVMIFSEEKQKKVSVDALVFYCENCNEKIPLTKKMKR